MIHGLGGTSNVWTPVLPALARHRTVRPDLPGSGRSHRVEGPLSIERFVAGDAARVRGAAGSSACTWRRTRSGTIVAFHLAVRRRGWCGAWRCSARSLCPPDPRAAGASGRAGEKARAEGEAGMQAIADALRAGGDLRPRRGRAGRWRWRRCASS